MTIRRNSQSGRNARKKKRLNAIKKFKVAFPNMLKKHFPNLHQHPRLATNHAQNLKACVDEIHQAKISLNAKRLFISQLNHFIDKVNHEENWNLLKARQINRAVRRPVRRTLGHFMLCNQFREWFQIFESIVKTTPLHDNPDALACYLLLSAMTYGGLATLPALKSFLRELNGSKFQLQRHNGLVWLNLIYEDFHSNPNVRQDDKELVLKRWFLDDLTLSLLDQYLTQASPKHLTPHEDEIWALIHRVTDQLCLSRLRIPGKNKLKTLCTIAYAGVEFQVGIHLPEYLIETTTGRLKTSSLPTSDFKGLLGLNTYTLCEIGQNGLAFTNGKHQRQQQNDLNRDIAFHELKSLYQILNKETRPKQAANSLENTIFQSEIINHLKLWAIYLLRERDIVLGSVQTYLRQISKFLILEIHFDKLENISSEDWHEIYQQVIERKTKVSERDRTAFRLLDFHRFHASHNRLIPLDFPLISGSPNRLSFVKAGFVDESLFEALRLSIRQSKHLPNNTKIQLELLTILAYRTGLRIGELVKLTTSDIEGKQQINLFVRDNFFGRNKSKNSRRPSPVWLLLPTKEYEIVSRFLLYLPRRPNHLIFHHDGKSDRQWNSTEVGRLISDLLKNISGRKHLSFHHLRHSALTRMQLIITQDSELISQFTAYSQEEAKRLYDYAFEGGNQGMAAYHHLAKMAGHAEPDTTFSHYLHLNDLLWFKTIQKRCDRLAPTEVANLFAHSKNQSTRITKSDNQWRTIANLALKNLTAAKKVKTLRNTKAKQVKTTAPIQVHQFTKENMQTILYHYVVLGRDLGSHWPDDIRSQIEASIQTSHNLALLKTTRKSNRFPVVVRKGTNQPYVFPFTDLRNCDLEDMQDLHAVLMQEHERSPSCLTDFIQDIILGSDQSKRGIQFKHPTRLKKFLSIITRAFPIERLQLEYEDPTKADPKIRERIRKNWASVFPGKMTPLEVNTKTPRSKFMSSRLKLMEVTIKQNQASPQVSWATVVTVLEFTILHPELLKSCLT